MRFSQQAAAIALGFAVLFLGACSTPIRTSDLSTAQSGPWLGRLALRVDGATSESAAQSLSAGFELAGTAQAGELKLLSPLGTTMAVLIWTAHSASLQAQGELRQFESLDALTRQALGTELPVGAMFAWLKGEDQRVPGWQVDLSAFANGRITALRTEPLPPAQLRLVLDH